MTANLADVRSLIRDIPDFPKPGIMFKDIAPVLADPAALKVVNDALCEAIAPWKPTRIAAMEARGFLFAMPVALTLGCGFVPLRKPGKLPYETLEVSYDLEYGSATLQMHKDGVSPGDRVVIVDDLFATGGTAKAAAELVEKGGAQVAGVICPFELSFLPWRKALEGRATKALMDLA